MYLSLPIVLQEDDYDCGAAVVASVLAYHHIPVPPRAELLARLGTTWESGTSARAIRSLLDALGLVVHAGHGWTLPRLRAYTAGGWPVLCPVQSGGSGHWVAVRGVDREGVYYLDPSVGYRVSGRAAWLRGWHDACDGLRYLQYGIAVGLKD